VGGAKAADIGLRRSQMAEREQKKEADLGAKLSYRREALRRSVNIRRIAIALLLNLLVVILVGSWVLLRFEKDKNPSVNTYGDAVWLSVITIATVGYGNSYPVTAGGKLTIIVMLASGAVVLSAFISQRSQRIEKERKRKVSGLDDKIKSRDHYVVCGWNERAPFLLDGLEALLKPQRIAVVLLSDLEDVPYTGDYVFLLRGRPTSERDLKRANIEEARVAVLLADESDLSSGSDADARTVLTALSIHSLNPAVRMTAEVVEPENIHHLELAGVDEVLDPNLLLGSLLARSARNFGLIGFVTQMLTAEPSEGLSRVEVDKEIAGMSPERREAYLVDELRVVPLALNSGAAVKHYSRAAELEPGDFIVVARLPAAGSGQAAAADRP
jgi:voltage-gated potassium channel